MLPKKNRLKKKEDFQKVLKKGVFFSFAEISCKVAKNGLENSRFAFLVKSKNSGGAARRNLVKRKMRAAILESTKKIPTGRDVMFFYSFPKVPEKKDGKVRIKMLELLKISRLI